MGKIVELSDKNFQAEVLQSPQPVLVDFWAPWCGPCRMLAPLVDQLADENAAALKVGKVNIDESPNIAASLGINSIPTIMIFKNGQVVDRFVGVQPKTRLQNAIEEATA